MSRRHSNKRRPLQRAAVIEQERPQEQRRVPNLRPGATNFVPLNDKYISQMYNAMSAQSPQTATPLYPPGAPIRPVPGITPPEGPRGFTYNVGYNIAQLPRSTEQYSFADLRAIASIYYGIQMCQQVWFDYISKLELVIEPRPDLIDEDEDVSQYQDDIRYYLDFFASPDKEHDFHEWLCMMVRDQLEIDAVSLYVRKDRAGRPFALDVIDSVMIKPLIDDRGRRPQPPFPAFEQFWNGVPASLLTSDDLLYIKETQRSDSVYGRSRVEKMMLYINLALRKQTKDLAHFTDGTLPQGFLKPSMDVTWSQEEMEAYEIQLNNYLAGNDELRARLKMLPRGFEVEVTDDPDIHIDLDTWILNVAAAFHGLTMDELAMTETSNRSVGQSQENVVYRRAMGPLMGRYAKLFTHILKKYFKENRFVCKLKGYEETEDIQALISAYSDATQNGLLGLSDANRLLKLPRPPDAKYIGRVLITKSGPMFLDDEEMMNAQREAQLAGLELAKQNPGAKPGNTTQDGEEPQDNEEEDTQQEETPQSTKGSTVSKKPDKGKGAGKGSTDDGKDGAKGERGDDSVTLTRLLSQVEEILARLPESTPVAQTEPTEQDVILELKRWREKAVGDMKAGRAQRDFTTVIIPESLHARISTGLAVCTTVDEVKEVFNRVRDAEREPHPLAGAASSSGGSPQPSKSNLKPKW